ncbi:thiamine phosphate synthase [Bacilliculturomica massiliensis]|uniref:thiamine phosphate synthase n=1 Tax=Bacilliculturomica massiliensis TaxID=1917867 RepID=UPI0010309AF7|nr:thiamine phosphate synthase [Bacilliculturomica massiliensis]
MKCDRSSLLLYAVTDRAWTTGGRTLLQQVEEALRGGVTCVQLREKDLPAEDFLAEARSVKALCRKYGVPFIVNDNVDVALRCGADGVHVGQHDMGAADVRGLTGAGMILGVSVQTVEQAVLAQRNGADYLGVGTMFPTSTKADALAVSTDTLKAICSSVSIPVCAIGGICAENMDRLSGCGADGVALVSAIFSAEDIEGECRRLRQLAEAIAGGSAPFCTPPDQRGGQKTARQGG